MSALQNGNHFPGMGQAGQRRGFVLNAVQEMFRLHAQRFDEFYLGQQYVAAAIVEFRRARMIEIHVFAQHRAAVNALVVNGDLVVGDVVIHDHFFRADDNHLAHLLRIQPAHVNVGHDFAGVGQA